MKYLSIDIGIINVGICILTLPDQHESLDALRKRRSTKFPYPRHESLYTLLRTDTSKVDHWSIYKIGESWESMDFLVPSICQHIRSLVTSGGVDMVLLERQPGINKKTSILVYSLFAHLLHVVPVRLVHGNVKIRVCNLMGLEKTLPCKKEKKRKNKLQYDQNKKIVVLGCNQLINQEGRLIPDHVTQHDGTHIPFADMKKRDDVADAILQAIGFHIYQPLIKVRTQQKPPRKKRRVANKGQKA